MGRTDWDCVQRCLAGDRAAFGQLALRHQGALLGYLAGRLPSRHLAEEAAQETFLRAYASLDRLRKPEAFFSWLVGIADRVAKEFQRDRLRQPQAVGLPSEPIANPRDGEATAVADDYLERVIAELPDSYRNVILLRYYAGMSCAEVAERLGVPLGTVTKTLSRAYARLRESLARYERRQARPEVRR